MWFQSPLWFVVASLFVCAGAIVAAFVRMRESGQELARLGQEIALKLKEHDDARNRRKLQEQNTQFMAAYAMLRPDATAGASPRERVRDARARHRATTRLARLPR